MIKIRFFDEVPADRFVPNSYAKLPRKEAIQYAIQGYGEVEIPLLPKDFPGRQYLFDAELYTLEDVQNNIKDLKNIDGIGNKTYKDIKDQLSAKRVMKIQDAAKSEVSFDVDIDADVDSEE